MAMASGDAASSRLAADSLPDVDDAIADPAFCADPYPLWARLRAVEPVHRSRTGLWLLTRYGDVEAALRDRRFSSDQARLPTRLRTLGQPTATSMEEIFGRSMLHLDPPEHTRLRRFVNPSFSPRRVEELRPLVEHIAELLLDVTRADGGMDAITDFAYPLPVTVIFEIFGIPFADRVYLAAVIRRHREARLRLVFDRARPAPPDAGQAVVRAAGATGADGVESSARRTLEDTAKELREYLHHLLALRADQVGTDLVSDLKRASEGGRAGMPPLSSAEVVGTAMLLLVAGQETTINLIGNGILALLRHPNELARLQTSPDLITGAVEELLRYDTPIQVIVRVLTEDVTISGTAVPSGSEVLAIAGAANRDPERFIDPDRLHLTRPEVSHLSFGGGPHYCLGATLARLEAKVAFSALIRHAPRLRLADEDLRWRPNPFLRGLESLYVEF